MVLLLDLNRTEAIKEYSGVKVDFYHEITFKCDMHSKISSKKFTQI